MNHQSELSTQQSQLRQSLRTSLRSSLRKRRQNLSLSIQQINAEQLSQRLLALKELKDAKKIAVYLSNDAEIDLSKFIKQLWHINKSCYLPVLNKNKKGHLLFLPYQAHQPLIKNCYNILEPTYNVRLAETAQQMDIIIMPLVGFDKNCNRIGMGGGYYDRSLNFMQSGTSTPKLIGVAHSIQVVDQIPVEKWDIKLHKIVTEKNINFI